MKKVLAIAMLLMFGIAQSAFAAGVVMPDKAMDNIRAGDWVITTDPSGNQTVNDVYFNNNDIQLLNESQTELKAVNNANAVASAIAVQTNIARVSSDNAPTSNVGVNGSNVADVTRYAPADYAKSGDATSHRTMNSTDTIKASSMDSESSCSESSTHAASNSEACNLNINYNDNEASAGDGQSVGKGDISQNTSSSAKVETLVVVNTKTESDSESCASAKEAVKSCVVSCNEEDKAMSSELTSENKTSETRNSKSENNHLTLLNTSQQNLMAVSNLNAVGSGAAVQTNIASNVGVSGTITHSNVAKVVSGL